MFKMRRYNNDWMVVVGIILVLLSIYGTTIFLWKTRLREEALINELRSMRIAVATFNILNTRNPKDISELAHAIFKTKFGDERTLVPKPILKRGLKDPFGNIYIYDAESGWIKSSTTNYELW